MVNFIRRFQRPLLTAVVILVILSFIVFFNMSSTRSGAFVTSSAVAKVYGRNVIENARALADSLQKVGFKIVSNGTDSHMVLLDLTPKGVNGADAEIALERSGITTNKNNIPNDPLPPMQGSGLRLGSPAGTTRGFGPAKFQQIGRWIGEVLDGVRAGGDNAAVEAKVKAEVLAMTQRFPIYNR